MNFSELDIFLKKETPNELWHKDHPELLSARYDDIPIVKHNGENLFFFNFTDDLRDNRIKLIKETRYTKIPQHFHNDMEMNYIYEGSCEFVINNTKLRLKKGDVCILGPDVVHSSEYKNENDIVITLIFTQEYFNDRYLNKIYEESIVSNFILGNLNQSSCRDKYLIFHTLHNEQFQSAIKNLICVYFDNNNIYEELSDLYVKLMFLYLLQIRYDNSLSDYKNIENASIYKILKYIEANATSCTLNDVSKLSGYTSNYACNLIKSHTGATFTELKLMQQFFLIEDLLINSNLPIYKVAELCGFTNLSFFYRKFQEKYNCKPKDFRKDSVIHKNIF
ncbi:AraC family transcriptional regulator [Fusibacter bizertensis]